ncbi:hypothetical protein JD844_001555 [Phrynosoma platyrhinos]|uniref:GFO/IDH/MocA-like oxidoreductase domain-containing protein n=1 Tax=Phrynosoma platyrhinos TaxID=52577 RepID=A0ABQ7TAT1_PHRPL|nr:hypothetical protein JD844_001555 [Phrynosoma platyrhinos]
MNAMEVKTMVKAAQEKKVFLMEAFWTRFFPASEKVCSLLDQRAVGDVVVLHAEIGRLPSVPWGEQKKLGGGALLAVGLYCVQLACMVFNREKPESIVASGFLYETGLKESPIMSHADSELVHSILDEVRKQLGVFYPQDHS